MNLEKIKALPLKYKMGIIAIVAVFYLLVFMGLQAFELHSAYFNLEEVIIKYDVLQTELAKYKADTSEIDMRSRISNMQPKLDLTIVNSICNAVDRYCEEYKLNTNLVVSLIYRESSFNLFAMSNKECYGLMQIRYKVHKKLLKELGINNVYELYHIDNNIKAGCAILSAMMTKEKTVSGALKRYVGGQHETYIPDIFRIMAEFSNPVGGKS